MEDVIVNILMSLAGFSLVTMWGMNLWELRQLRKDNRELSQAIATLSSAISSLQVQLSFKVGRDDCAEHRSGFERRVDVRQ